MWGKKVEWERLLVTQVSLSLWVRMEIGGVVGGLGCLKVKVQKYHGGLDTLDANLEPHNHSTSTFAHIST